MARLPRLPKSMFRPPPGFKKPKVEDFRSDMQRVPLREKEVTFRGLTLMSWWIQSIVKELLFLWRTLHVRTVS